MKRRRAYLIVVRQEGDFREVWEMSLREAKKTFKRVVDGGSLTGYTSFGGRLEKFRPCYVAVVKELSNFDTILGRSR